MRAGAICAATVPDLSCALNCAPVGSFVDEVGMKSEDPIAAMITAETSAADRHADACPCTSA